MFFFLRTFVISGLVRSIDLLDQANFVKESPDNRNIGESITCYQPDF